MIQESSADYLSHRTHKQIFSYFRSNSVIYETTHNHIYRDEDCTQVDKPIRTLYKLFEGRHFATKKVFVGCAS